MKKKWWVAALLCIVLMGCSDRSYKGYVDMGKEEEFPDEPVPVMVAVGDPSYSVLSRGAGAFDSIKTDSMAWKQAVFHVYAFNRDESTDFSVRWEHEGNTNKDVCLIDGSMDTEGAKSGKPARMNKSDYSFLEWTQAPYYLYYNSLHPNLPYNFYAYYVDSMNVQNENIHREAHRIYFDVEIDGTQDLMSSFAKLTPTQEDEIESNYFGDNKTKLINSLYSAYSANRGINPMFTFQHHLARFKFRIYPGKPEADSVYVDSICIYSCTKGVFTVVSRDVTKMGVDFSGDQSVKPLYLKERGGNELDQMKYRIPYNPDKKPVEEYEKTNVYSRGSIPVGESLLVAPADSYKIIVHLREVYGTERPPRYYLTEYTLTSAIKDNVTTSGFSPGQAYLVRIAVFGAQEIKVQVVTAEQWGDGGYVDVNPDDIFEY